MPHLAFLAGKVTAGGWPASITLWSVTILLHKTISKH